MAETSLRTASQPSTRAETEDAFLDAAERLLIGVGYAGITTRRLAEEAGANHGLVHYYFGSMENLFVRVLERFTDRLVARQREMYARTDISGVEKWRTAMGYLEYDLAAGYPKIWLELQALGWNRPDIAERVAGSTASGATCSPTPSTGCSTSTASIARSSRSRRWSAWR